MEKERGKKSEKSWNIETQVEKPPASDSQRTSKPIMANITPSPRTKIHALANNMFIRLILLVSLTIISIATRLHKIAEPAHICWDETHFGKMASWYIKGEFFFDVHPPLAKMMIGLSGILTGYNGTFPFGKPGEEYGDETQFVGMRQICAIVGSLVVPLCYETVFLLTHSLLAAILAAFLLIFDPGMITISQYILLDQWLLFAIMSAVVSITKFRSLFNRPFSHQWWAWLALTGMCISLAMGVKFVGLFVVLYVGFNTIADLWNLLGDLSVPMKTISKHFVARAVLLIMLPAVMYTGFYYIHFKVLYKSGNGDGFFSSAFQSELIGNRLHNASMPEEIAFGSVVTIKNNRIAGAYLHSHIHLYPEDAGPKQQQITTYSHKDDNNKWIIKKHNQAHNPDDPVEFIHSGDWIRLEHIVTRRNLHSHREPAPITKSQRQVSCYGQNGTGDANDYFKIVAVNQEDRSRIRTVRTRFQLVHVNQNCVVKSHDKKLPKWGWEQLEVTCNPEHKDKYSYWNIEEVFDSRLPNTNFEVYAPNFFEKIFEAHAVMFQGNAGLKPKEGEVTSQPWQWPFNYRGQRFSGGDFRVYLLGNPIIWWGNLVAITVFGFIYLFHAIRKQRGYVDPRDVQSNRERVFNSCGWLLIGWALHYFPFWAMGRVLYFHHYFPALLFNSMFTGIVLEYVLNSLASLVPERFSWNVYHTGLGIILSALFYSFYLFHPLAYGMTGPTSENEESMMYKLKWMDSWEI